MEIRTKLNTPVSYPTFQKRKSNCSLQPQKNESINKNNVFDLYNTCLKNQGIAQVSFGSYNKLISDIGKKSSSILTTLTETKVNGNNFEKALYHITKDKDLSKKFIGEVTENPRDSQKIAEKFVDKLGPNNPLEGIKKLHKWLQAPDGYNTAFKPYASDVVQKAKTSEEVLGKLGADVGIWVIRDKSKNMGKVPSEFVDEKHFGKFMDNLRESKGVKLFTEINEETKNIDKFVNKYFNREGQNGYRPKNHKKMLYNESSEMSREMIVIDYAKTLLEENVKQDIKVGTKNYNVETILGGVSGKMVFKVDTPNKNSFILKANPKVPDNALDLENMNLRSDSPYFNAVVGFFLKEHKCKGVPLPEYYNYDKAAVVSPFIKGKSLVQGNEYEEISKKQVNEYLKDMKSLGIQPNDVASKNFIKEDGTGTMYYPDLGNVGYADIWRPLNNTGIKSGQLPNMVGVDPLVQDGMLLRVIKDKNIKE